MESLNKVKIGQYGPFVAYQVNGHAVRDSSLAAEEFGGSAIHEDFPLLIPENELWIEDDVPPEEIQFEIINLLFRRKLLVGGLSKDQAYDKALEYERQIRQNYQSKRIGDIRVRQLGTYDRYSIWLVDGFIVRNRYKTDFIEGGNHSRYPWIPINEIWIEVALHEDEYPFIIAHEAIEDYLMGHIGWAYEKAHSLSSAIEYELRKRTDLTWMNSIPLAFEVLRKMRIRK